MLMLMKITPNIRWEKQKNQKQKNTMDMKKKKQNEWTFLSAGCVAHSKQNVVYVLHVFFFFFTETRKYFYELGWFFG